MSIAMDSAFVIAPRNLWRKTAKSLAKNAPAERKQREPDRFSFIYSPFRHTPLGKMRCKRFCNEKNCVAFTLQDAIMLEGKRK